jgi:superfamily II DNA or RNA helicase
MHLYDGLYDKLVTDSLAESIAQLRDQACRTLAPLPPEQASERIANILAKQLVELLDELEGEKADKVRRQLAFVNDLLVHLRTQATAVNVDLLSDPAEILQAVQSSGSLPELPETGLAIPWLFTAGKDSPALLTELRRELAGCDQVDMLVSFITVAGVRKVFDILQKVTAADAGGRPRTRLRILTTTYTGVTELEALDYFARLPGCEIRVSLDGRRTRLHAKAWIFHRQTGFGSAYVGSANLSGAALLGGLEWTVKFTEQGQANLFSRAKAHFETLWNDSEFQLYDASNPDHRSEFSRALKREAGDQMPATATFFDLEPKDYQKDMLEQLAAEREHGRMRNLVVAATGTGKTVVAAFDYRTTCRKVGGRPRLLFVAHRKEILTQARRAYREVLKDNSFGEILADGAEPPSYEHIFAVIDSVCSRSIVEKFGPRYWHTVVIDECHRLAADRFDSFVKSVMPNILIGLTATPERSDGKPIYPYFDNRPDGSPAVELRLWHALDLQLLSPFEYYGCDDETDFSSVPWDRPGERDAVDKLVTGNEVRARLVIDEWRRLTGDPRRTKTLVFCVSVSHAEYMAQRLNDAGLPALCVIGSTDPDIRRQAPQRLFKGELCALVTCDLYNEGVDLPSVDTLLLLRPTQSPVLFQQQIGRGLRLSEGKESCLVLDFVGRYRTDFRFERLLSPLTGLSRTQLVNAVEKGFSQLPPGCHIHLQQVTKDQILRSLRTAINQSWRRLQTELQSYVSLKGRAHVRLADFLRDQALRPEEIYRDQGRSGWTSLKRAAGITSSSPAPEDDYFSHRFSDLLHINDPEQCELLLKLSDPKVTYETLGERERLRLQLLAYQIDGQHQQTGTGHQFLTRLANAPELRSELGELGGVLEGRSNLRFQPIPGLEDVPLCLHASCGSREILTAVEWLTPEKRTPFQAGVLALQNRKVELLFVTLDKSQGFHDAIAYRDYAISPERFHWQTQNSAGPETTAGQRYLNSPGNGWSFQLFVRRTQEEPYCACGPVYLEGARGEKPMSIEWRLGVPLPLRLFQEFSILRG